MKTQFDDMKFNLDTTGSKVIFIAALFISVVRVIQSYIALRNLPQTPEPPEDFSNEVKHILETCDQRQKEMNLLWEQTKIAINTYNKSIGKPPVFRAVKVEAN